MFEYGGLSVHRIFFYFKECGMTFYFYQNVKKGKTSLKELIFLLLNLLEKSLIPTNINIVFMVISYNSIVPLK